MGTSIHLSVNMVAETCWVCGTAFAMSYGLHAKRKADGGSFYCPNGCHLGYGESQVEKLQKEIAREKHLREQETARLRDAVAYVQSEHERTQASLRSTKGVVTRIKRRVGKGVCPCCNRTFADLAAHMTGQHPDWSNGDE